MSLSRSVTACLLAGFCAAGAARAADDGQLADKKLYTAPEIVVTASRMEWPVDKTASFVTVISKDEIQRQHAGSASELLRSVVGLGMVQSGSKGKAASLFIRGANSNHCLVMVDGVPLNDPGTGAFDFSDLSAAAISRIEVVRGPNGILYGSSAIGGVVNIITGDKSGESSRSISLAGGSFGSAEGSLDLSGDGSSTHWSGSLAGATSEGAADNDFYRNLSFAGSLSHNVTSTAKASLNLRYGWADNGLRGSRYAPDPNAEQKGDHLLAAAGFQQFVSEKLNYSVRASYFDRNIDFEDPLDSLDSGPFAGSASQTIDSRVANVAAQSNMRFGKSLWAIAGGEWKQERTTNHGVFPYGPTDFDNRITNASVFANGILDIRGLPTGSAGVRLDDHSEFGAVATYKYSLSYPIPRTGASLKASIGTGFRAPSLNELYYPGYGNPKLSPERTMGWDCGVRQEIGKRASFEVAYFHNEYRNMISYNPATWLADNIGHALSEGAECSATYKPLASITIEGFYAFTRTEDLATGKELLRRPRHSGGLSVSYRGGPVDAALSGSFVGARLDNDFGGPRGEFFNDRYARLDATVTYRVSGSRELFCRAGNLTNERYDEVAGYPAPQANVMAGTRLAF
jgi:vitamin B12 transporter